MEKEKKAHPLQCLEGDTSCHRDNNVVGSHSWTDLLQDTWQDVWFGGQEDQGSVLKYFQVAVRGPAARLLPMGQERCHSPMPPTPGIHHSHDMEHLHAWSYLGDTFLPQSHQDFSGISPRSGKHEPKPFME